MAGVELTCEQESVVQQCYEIAAQLVNLKQVKKDSHKYENEYDTMPFLGIIIALLKKWV